MDKHQLAKELRQRQYDTGLVPRHMIDALPDDEVIDSYNTCSHCGEKQVNEQNLEIAIRQAENARHFLELCDQLADARYKEAHPAEQRLAPFNPSTRSPWRWSSRRAWSRRKR